MGLDLEDVALLLASSGCGEEERLDRSLEEATGVLKCWRPLEPEAQDPEPDSEDVRQEVARGGVEDLSGCLEDARCCELETLDGSVSRKGDVGISSGRYSADLSSIGDCGDGEYLSVLGRDEYRLDCTGDVGITTGACSGDRCSVGDLGVCKFLPALDREEY